jgi:hypothetical protein
MGAKEYNSISPDANGVRRCHVECVELVYDTHIYRCHRVLDHEGCLSRTLPGAPCEMWARDISIRFLRLVALITNICDEFIGVSSAAKEFYTDVTGRET